MPLSKLGQAAFAYAGLGLHVLPLWGVSDGVCLCPKKRACGRDTGKHPIRDLVSRGKNEASNNLGVVCGWWERVPDANIGVACGQSGLLAVDIDPRSGGNETWEQLLEEHGQPPDTAEAETGGGGRHLVFRRPPEVPAKDSKLGAGIDIKADGYIVVAPSVHKSGREYTWLAEADPFDGAPFADPPSWLIEKLQKKNGSPPPSMSALDLVYRYGAKPPTGFWDALKKDAVLSGIWERTHFPPNQKDFTPSGLTMSLRKRLVAHRLTPQGALDTMVAYRRKHGDKPNKRNWFLNEAAQYAADLEQPSSPSQFGEPPVALQRQSPGTRRSLEVVEEALRHGELLAKEGVTAAEVLLLVRLARYANDRCRAWPAQKTLAREMQLSEGYVSRRLSSLSRRGCIRKVQHSGPGMTNVWEILIFEPHQHEQLL